MSSGGEFDSDDDSLAGLTIEEHHKEMEVLKAEFEELKAIQYKKVMGELDKKIHMIEQGQDGEYLTQVQTIEHAHKVKQTALKNRLDLKLKCIEIVRVGEKEFADQNLKEEMAHIRETILASYSAQLCDALLDKTAAINAHKTLMHQQQQALLQAQQEERDRRAAQLAQQQQQLAQHNGESPSEHIDEDMTLAQINSAARNGHSSAFHSYPQHLQQQQQHHLPQHHNQHQQQLLQQQQQQQQQFVPVHEYSDGQPAKKKKKAASGSSGSMMMAGVGVWTGPYIVYMLTERDIGDDLRVMNTVKPVKPAPPVKK